VGHWDFLHFETSILAWEGLFFSLSTILMGDTNFIAVDRDNILDVTFEELKTVQDPWKSNLSS